MAVMWRRRLIMIMFWRRMDNFLNKPDLDEKSNRFRLMSKGVQYTELQT